MSSERSTRVYDGGALGDFELNAVAPFGLTTTHASTRKAEPRDAAVSSSTFFALVFLGTAPGDEEGCASGVLLLHLRQQSTRVLVLTPASVTVSPTRGSSGPATEKHSLEEHSIRLVSRLFPDFVLDEVRSMSGRGIMVVDPETWITLLGVEPWQFGVYSLEASDIKEAGCAVIDENGNPCFSLRDTAPLFNFTRKRRVDELRRLMRRSCALRAGSISTKRDSEMSQTDNYDGQPRRATTAEMSVDEVMELVGLTDDATEVQQNTRLLKARARRKERKQLKKAIRRERTAQETKSEQATPMLSTPEDDGGSVGTAEEASRDALSIGSPAHCVTDIEDIEVEAIATTTDSKDSVCTVSCGECAYVSTCDRKRKLDDVIKNTSHEGSRGCAFAYCSMLAVGKEVELSQYVTSMPKRLRRVTAKASHREAPSQDWVVIGKNGRAVRGTSGENDAVYTHSVVGESHAPNVQAAEIDANTSSLKHFNEVMTSLRALKDENQRLKAELSARKRKTDAGTISTEQIARAASILSVVHHWFSIGNLYRDEFLRSQMDANGFVSLHTLCTFPSLVRLSVTPSELALLLTSSPFVDLNSTRDACRSATAAHLSYNVYQHPSCNA